MPGIGPGDHVRGPEGAGEAILYLDLACPHCAADWARIRDLRLRLCVRHFPVSSRRPRAAALHAATEAAATLGGEEAFWRMWDSLLADPAHQDDPHLWKRAEAIGLETRQFEEIRRSPAIAERVHADFVTGIRAGVVGTPTGFHRGSRIERDLVAALSSLD